ncbi:hypothetical protein FH972_003186 [Carpinus fangiana]|uniref:Histidine-containing phosphotransfer protein n=1 Tax=Carpinus fangiana TaxID=176857 RepID=A0A5N6QHN7_9ROSI|nr:hypothetical protein FH972_003186 [Carpinus fangiana]
MDSNSNFLKQQIATMRESLFTEGILNEQYATLEGLTNDDNPYFAERIVNMYLAGLPKHMIAIEQALEATPVDFGKLDICINKFRGTSSSVGTHNLVIEIDKMVESCTKGNIEGCKIGFSSMKQELDIMKNKLGAYQELLKQDRGGSPLPDEEDMVTKSN